MTSEFRQCIYCKERPTGDSEHIFPKGLGGEDLYMYDVCDDCNNYFSKLEGELFRNSPIALMRSAERVLGYGGKKLRETGLTFPEIFQFVEKDQVPYEIGVFDGARGYMRPQLIQINEEIYIEGANEEEVKRFCASFEKWRINSGILVVNVPKDKSQPLGIVKFVQGDEQFSIERLELTKAKNSMSLVLLAETHPYKAFLEPRLFYNEDQRLVLRCRSEKEGIDFLCRLLDKFTKEGASFTSFSNSSTKDKINVSFKVDPVKIQQALVKIGLNSLVYYKEGVRNSPFIDPAINFVMAGEIIGGFVCQMEDKIDSIDLISDCHRILLIQVQGGVKVRINLFSGFFIFSFYLNDLVLSNELKIVGVLNVNYKCQEQRFYDENNCASLGL
ncbi:HNH endonuclease [Chitinophaga eiseniae]|uniref:HNH endonuclease n=1 Tax=Chitinophaga eiseniae TaxID=634771 RepID=A0A1T4NUD0_9BACT|nr:HNH endonuclease [Chitinophaga eiseniae]SJZ82980.1 HNH endonuclease [Chitinophaga eiseniae]